MKVLSLFDGLGGLRIALDRLGITPSAYYASEIDKHAMQVSGANYPDIIQLGSVTDWKGWNIDYSEIDLVTGGFPCQSWSVAGKQQGDRDERGALFWVMLDIMQAVLKANPKAKFMMENVRMKKEFEEYITHHTEQALGHVYKTLINSALVSAQNRNRFYWTNFEVTQPEDLGISLSDIVEVSQEQGLPQVKGGAVRGRYVSGGSGKTEQRLEVRRDNKANALTTVGKDSVVVERSDKPVRVGELGNGGQGNRIYSVGGKSPSLIAMSGGMAGNGSHLISDDGGESYRKLTPLECERLQTIPDKYTEGVSNTQRYRMLGNGFTVEVIVHILKHILKGK